MGYKNHNIINIPQFSKFEGNEIDESKKSNLTCNSSNLHVRCMQMIKSLSSGPEKKMSRNQIDDGMSAWKNEGPQVVIFNTIGNH